MRYKVFSVGLALIVLCSTLSFTIEKHYCGGILVEVSMFAESVKCGMHGQATFEKPPCCKDEIAVVQGQDTLQLSVLKTLKFYKYPITLASIPYFSLSVLPQLERFVCFQAHAPPTTTPNIQIRDQVFLI
jgi:hypothetical protein